MAAVSVIANAETLPTRERDRRIRLLVDRLSPAISDLASFLTSLRAAAPNALNAVRAALPPEFRPLAIVSLLDATVPAPQRGVTAERVAPADGDSPAFGAMFGVALVGTESEHTQNTALLRDSGLSSLRVETISQLEQLGPSGLCGFVVASSAWSGLDEGSQLATIRTVAKLSTFLFARMATDGLSTAVAARAISIASDARCGVLDGERFCHGRDCALSPADVQTLLATAKLLTAAEGAGFFPLGVDEQDVRLLRLIAADRRRPSDPVSVSRLGTRELAGGRSGARLYMLQPHTGGPFVVKLHHEPESLSSELRRHQRWIADWEPNLTNPSLHLHLGRAAISFRLQAAPDKSSQAAPTLDDEIERLRAQEWNTAVDPSWLATDLETAVCRAADRLAELNRKVPTPGTEPGEFWLDWPLKCLGTRGILHQLRDKDGQAIDLLALTSRAVDRFRQLAGRGIVHGDINGRNLLLVDRLPAFIDYEASGPGHPLEDLVRLDATVRAAAFRSILDERELSQLFRSIYVNGETSARVLDRYPPVATSACCRLAIVCAEQIRKRVLEVAAAHGGGVEDYLAMVTIVSGFILAHRAPTSSVERSLLSALA
ncbi:MAG: phosphotransferase [Phycisphaerales bacterium]